LAEPSATYPHDYRLIAESDVRPVIVGGQAVNIWAIAYLLPERAAIEKSNFASGDLDVLANNEVLQFLKTVPGWRFENVPMHAWTDTRAGFLHGKAEDGRALLVEALTKVHGLDAADLKAVTEVESFGVRYAVLDPVAMLKAKAANVRDIDQVGPPVRHDRQHLQLIARCFPRYLRTVHDAALQDPTRADEAAHVFSRAFATLTRSKTAETLLSEGISPANLMPPEVALSPIEKIRNAYTWQLPRLTQRDTSRRPDSKEQRAPLQNDTIAQTVSNERNDHDHAEEPTAALPGSHPGTVGREGPSDRPSVGSGNSELAPVHERPRGPGTGDDREDVRRERGEEAERLSRSLLLSADRAARLFRAVREHVEIDVFGFNDRRGFRSLPDSVQIQLSEAAARYGNAREFFAALQNSFAHAQEDPALFATSVQITPPETGKTIPDGATAIVFTEGSHRCAQIDFLPPGPPEPGSFPPERLMVDGYAMPAGLETLPAGRYVIEDGRAEPEQTIENPQLMPKDHVGEYARCSDDTRGLREEKERLYAQGFPILESQATVAKYYSAEKFDHLRSVSKPVYFCAPSTTGENILPYILAQNLRRDFGGVIMPDWATPQALTRTAEKTGIEKLREPPTYKLNKDALALVGKDATIVLVDDVVTTGGSVQGMREALAQEGLRASHVTSLAQSELRLVTEKDIDRMTAKLLGNEGRDAFARSRGFADFSAFAANEPHHADPERSGFTAWLREQPLRADVALALDGRLKHLANYIENSIRKTDANRNAEISEHLRAEAQRLRELGRTDAGAVLGIDERVRRLEGTQFAPRSVPGVDAGVSREGGAIRPSGPDPEGRDAAAAGHPPAVTETAKPLQASEALDRLTALRLEYADNPDKHVLTEARGIAEAITGPAVTRVPFAVSAVEYVKGNISRADLELVAAKNDRAAAHDKSPKPDRSQDNDLGR